MCDDEVQKVRMWFRENGNNINSIAWDNTVEEIKAMKIAGYVRVADVNYEIKEMIYDKHAEALILELERA